MDFATVVGLLLNFVRLRGLLLGFVGGELLVHYGDLGLQLSELRVDGQDTVVNGLIQIHF